MFDKDKTLKKLLNLWNPELQTSKTSFDLSTINWSIKSPPLKRQKTFIPKSSDFHRSSTLKIRFDNDLQEISNFLHFKLSDKFTNEYPVDKVLYINNFSKTHKNNVLITNKFIFHIRKKQKRFVAAERLNDELRDIFKKETNKPNLNQISGLNCKENGILRKKELKTARDLNKYEEKKKEKIKNLKFDGKKVLSTYFAEKNNENIKINELIKNKIRAQVEKPVRTRPYSASSCFESAGRQFKFVENLLQRSKKLYFPLENKNNL